MSVPARIRNPAAYRDGQPDLDIYNKCFEGFASPAFRGSDLDGLFVATAIPHGMWERHGYVLILEHKAAATSWKWGQWHALNQAAENGQVDLRTHVVVTYGEPNWPTSYQLLPLPGWRNRICACDFEQLPMSLDDIDRTPMRRWIKWVHERTRGPW